MSRVTSSPISLSNGDVVTEFTDVANMTTQAFKYNTTQNALTVENCSPSKLTLSVGGHLTVIDPYKKWRGEVEFSSFSIKSERNSQHFIARSIRYPSISGIGAFKPPDIALLGDTVRSNEGFISWFGEAPEDDLIHTKYANKSIKATSLNGAATAIRNRTMVPLSFNGVKSVTINVFVEGAENILDSAYAFASIPSFADCLIHNVYENQYSEGWNEITFDPTKMTVDGADLITKARVAFQMRVQAKAGTTCSISFDSIVFKRDSSAKVIFMMDDGWISQYNDAFPLLLERGLKGNIGVIPTWIGSTPEPTWEKIMSLSQLDELYRYGWDLFNHTYTHPNLAMKTAEEVVKQVVDCKNWLNDKGYTRAADILAYPYGGHNTMVVDALSPHIRYGRTLIEGLESNPKNTPLRGKTRNVVQLSADTLKGYVDEAINTGQTLVFCSHMIATTPTHSMQYKKADFITVLDYIKSKKDLIENVTVSEWVDSW